MQINDDANEQINPSEANQLLLLLLPMSLRLQLRLNKPGMTHRMRTAFLHAQHPDLTLNQRASVGPKRLTTAALLLLLLL